MPPSTDLPVPAGSPPVRHVATRPDAAPLIEELCEAAYRHRGQALAAAERALDLAMATGDSQLITQARIYLAGHYASLEDSRTARQLLQQAQEFYDETDTVDRHRMRLHHFWGMCLACEREFLDAHRHFTKALDYSIELAEEYDQQLNLDFTGYNYVEMGMAQEAISFLMQSVTHPHGDVRLVCNSNLALAEAHMLREQWDRARSHVLLAFAAIEDSRDLLIGRYAAAAAYGAMVAVREGKLGEARAFLERVDDLDSGADAVPSFPGMYDIATAEVLIAEGRFDEAMATCDTIIHQSRRDWSQAVGRMLKAEALSRTGQFAEATAIFEAADGEALSFFYNDKLHRLMIDHYQRMDDWRRAFGVLQRYNDLKFVRQTNVSTLVELQIKDRHERAMQRKNDQLEGLLKEKTELLQLVAHDLNNPITAILLSAQLADHLLATGNDEKLSTAISRIEQSAKHTADIAAQIVIMSKLEENKITVVSQTVAADEIVLQALDRAAHQMEAKRIRCDLTMEDGLYVTADRQILAQTFDNLVSNCIKYSPFDSTVDIDGRGTDRRVVFKFVDHGVGIDADEMPRLFSKFGRLSQRPTNGESSTGLGMYNTRRQLELIGATITASSGGIGHGTTFVVTLQRANDGAVAVASAVDRSGDSAPLQQD